MAIRRRRRTHARLLLLLQLLRPPAPTETWSRVCVRLPPSTSCGVPAFPELTPGLQVTLGVPLPSCPELTPGLQVTLGVPLPSCLQKQLAAAWETCLGLAAGGMGRGELAWGSVWVLQLWCLR
jgi:hypothetical protein